MVWTVGFDTDMDITKVFCLTRPIRGVVILLNFGVTFRPLRWGCVSSFRHIQMEAGNGIAPRKPRYERDGGTTHLLSLQMVAPRRIELRADA